MHRRDFLIKSGMLGTGAFLARYQLASAEMVRLNYPELAGYKIARIEYGTSAYRWPRHVGRNARIGIHGQDHTARFVRLYTDQGAMGWGALGWRYRDENLDHSSILGKSLSELIHPSEGLLTGVNPIFDIALFDLAGIILNKPVYQLIGAKGPRETDVYSGMIYFDEMDKPSGLDQVMDNCKWDYDYGYRQLKVKIGRSGRWYLHDEGLAMDIKIIQMIHEEYKDKNIDILVDANDMYSLHDTLAFLQGVEGVPVFWVEEPFVENLEEGRILKQWMMANGRGEIYYADGERDPDHEVCKQLARENMLDVYLSDVVDFGFSPWIKLMPFLKDNDTLASPHAWGSLLKTHYSSHIAAGLGNVVTLEGVTCLSDDIDFGDYKIKKGKLRVSEKPGFGMNILK